MQKNARLISGLMISTALISTAAPAFAVDALETPMGGSVVAGNAAINYGAPGQVTINQGSDRTVINWDSFNIGQNAGAEFVQPNSNALAVNRVTGAGTDPTQILGSLRANGRVMVLDRNGVIFGKQARVDVGGIVASTGDVNNAQVMSGSDRIELTQTGSTGTVENLGDITVAEGGLAALVAPTVRNNGTINARLGRVGLASGDKVTVDLYGDNLIEMEVNGTAQHALVEQNGTINAEGGLVQISTRTAKDVVDNVINLDGVTNVSSVSQQGGRIVLSGGTVNVRGTANATGRRGGSVRVNAENINMAGTAVVRADSNAGEAAGRVDLVATNTAKFDGTISAVGAKGTGFVDTSASVLDFGNDLRVMATDTWMIDPINITIGNILEFALELQLNFFGNALVTTSLPGLQAGNVTVNNTVNWNTSNSLTVNADNDITFNAGGGFVSTGAGNINLNADRNILVAGNGVRTAGGDITINSRRFRLTANEVNAGGGDISINNTGGFQALANSIKTSGTGTIDLNQNKDASAFFSANTIQNAIYAIANAGTGTNTIDVGAGNWAEAVTVDRSVELYGNNAGVNGYAARGPETAITTPGTGFTVTGNNVVIDGFKLDASNLGINVNGATGTKISHNLFVNNVANAIALTSANGTTISYNAVDGTGSSGVIVNSSNNVSVSNNKLSNTGSSAINATLSNNATIQNNIIFNTGNNAVSLQNSAFANILNNYIGYTDTGVTSAGAFNIKGDGIKVTNSDNNAANRTYIQGNHVTDTKSLAWDNGSGIEVLGSDYVVIGGVAGLANFVTKTNWDAIRVQSVQDTTITGNQMSNLARSGIYIGSSNRVTATGNTSNGSGTHYGVHVDNSANTTVSGNTLSNIFQDGIFFEKSSGTNVADYNTISYTGDDGIAALNSSNVSLFNNTIHHTTGNGIELNTVTGASVVNANIVDSTGSDGIFTFDSSNLSIRNNLIGQGAGSTIKGDGIYVRNSHNTSGQHSVVLGNTISNTLSPAWDKGSGVHVWGSEFVDVGGTGLDANIISKTAWDGVRIISSFDTVVANNQITDVKRTGIYLGSSNRLTAKDNQISGTSSHFGIHGENSVNLTLDGNSINNTFQDGIFLEKITGTALVVGNTITNSKDDGIAANNVNVLNLTGNTIGNSAGSFIRGDGVDATDVNILMVGSTDPLDANIIDTVDGNGIVVNNAGNGTAAILNNQIANIGLDGVQANNVDDLVVGDNQISTVSGSGVHVAGKHYGNSRIYGNTVTDAATGMTLESGLVDLTGTTNTLTGGDVGLRFISSNVDLAGDTIGTTNFNGQATYYVELLNGALFAPGSPTIIDGVNATYDGLNPVLTGGVVTALELATLEGKIWHFNDDATVGLFFFGSVPLAPAALTFDDEDAFNTFSSFAPAAGRIGLTIAGLPRIPGAPAPAAAPAAPNDITNPDVLNTLSPAAGGEQPTQEPTAEQVAAIAPAAGGQDASCWSDATNLAGSGQTVNYNFSTDANSALADAAACGNSAP